MLSININPALFDALENHAQAVPKALLNDLALSAKKHQVSLSEEIITRILATFTMPEAFGLNEKAHEVLNKKFSGKEAFAEIIQMRQGWLYIYEMEKLRLFLKFSRRLPRQFKENFSVIDVKTAMKRINNETKGKYRDTE